MSLASEQPAQVLDLVPATVDADGLIRFYNRYAAEICGNAPRLGDPDLRYFGCPGLVAPDGAPVDRDRSLAIEQQLRHRTDSLKLLSDTATRLLLADHPESALTPILDAISEHLRCSHYFNFLVVDDDPADPHLSLNAYAGIDAANGPDTGSTFTLALPAAMPAPHPAPAGHPKTEVRDSKSLAILLVEDHESTAALLTRLLRASGHQITTASTLEGGLGLCRSTRFDLLISDLGLPDGSGLDLLPQLDPASRPRHAIALSGYGTEEDITRSHAAGFAAHLTKPIDLQHLQLTIAEVVQENGVVSFQGSAKTADAIRSS